MNAATDMVIICIILIIVNMFSPLKKITPWLMYLYYINQEAYTNFEIVSWELLYEQFTSLAFIFFR